MRVRPIDTTLTPEQAAQRLCSRPGACWLDGDGTGDDGRWSFVGSDPVDWLRLEGPSALDALDALALPAASAPAVVDGPAPADVPAWIGHVRYDGAVCFGRYDALLAFDHVRGCAFVVGDDDAACARLTERLASEPRRAVARVEGLAEPDPRVHLHAIRAALEHIACGDIYQVNLARRWSASLAGDAFALFEGMRDASPVPLGFYQDDGERVVCARTMERFLRWDPTDGTLRSRPIKGTIARGDGAVEALRADPKERAEHAMIVDLVRNDLGRVAEIGSVVCSQVMAVEPYRGLHHLVSTVACRTRPGVTRADVLRATFPPGSVTGAPKIRALQVIAAIEPVERDVYTGALGFVDRAGGLSLAVAIRTAVVRAGRLRYWAGGGIVEASDPERELAETELKARVFAGALQSLAQQPASVLLPHGVLR